MALTRNGLTGASFGHAQVSYLLQQLGYVGTVAGLPAAATVGPNTRGLVTDASATTFGATIGVSGKTVAGGGTNQVPVYVDNNNQWRVG